MSPKEYLNPENKISNVERVVQQHPETAGLQAYEYFRNTLSKQGDAYIAGDVDELDFKYPYLNLEAIEKIKEPMLESLIVLMPGEQNLKSKSLYSAIEYRYSELFMLDMARVMNDESMPESDRKDAEEQFKISSEALYGKPELEVFSFIASKTIKNDQIISESDSPTIKKLKNELRNLLGEIDESEYVPVSPSSETIELVHGLVIDKFEPVLSHIEIGNFYGVEGMVQAIDTALDKLGGKDLGWTAVKTPDSNSLAVSAHQKQLQVGENRKEISGKELKHKVIHELGVHGLRSMNAERAAWLSAAYGQEGYLNFEESLGTALEDAYLSKYSSRGETYYLVAGLAYGLDHHEPRNFEETYEIMWRHNLLAKEINDPSEIDITRAKTVAFNSCLRLFRGTTGKQKGVLLLKDLAYFNGQESVWKTLEDIKSKEDFDLLFSGKLDNSKSDQQLIAKLINDFLKSISNN